MRKLSRKWKLWGLFFVLMFFAAGAPVHTTATDVQAATKNGFKTDSWQQLFHIPLDDKTENYSTGMRKKLALLAVLKLD